MSKRPFLSTSKTVIGVVYPYDVDFDDDLRRFLPEDVTLVLSPTPGITEPATVRLFTRMAEHPEIEEAALQLLKFKPDCIAYTDTSI